PKLEAEPDGKSGFLAAARRAAQIAMRSAKPKPLDRPADKLRAPEPDLSDYMGDDEEAAPSLRSSVKKKLKSVLIAASLVAIIVGGIQAASTFFNFGSLSRSSQNKDADLTTPS